MFTIAAASETVYNPVSSISRACFIRKKFLYVIGESVEYLWKRRLKFDSLILHKAASCSVVISFV